MRNKWVLRWMQQGMREGVKVKRYREDTEKGGCLANFPMSGGSSRKSRKGKGRLFLRRGSWLLFPLWSYSMPDTSQSSLKIRIQVVSLKVYLFLEVAFFVRNVFFQVGTPPCKISWKHYNLWKILNTWCLRISDTF